MLVLAAYRQFALLLYLPVYVLFRLLRSYYSLEMLFTLPLGAPPARKRLREPVTRVAERPRDHTRTTDVYPNEPGARAEETLQPRSVPR